VGEEPGFALVGLVWIALAVLLECPTRAPPPGRESGRQKEA
jgi:hypothetical protein